MKNGKIIIYKFKRGDYMMTTGNLAYDEREQELELFAELDKGIDDMEAGHVVSHKDAMLRIRESVDAYAL